LRIGAVLELVKENVAVSLAHGVASHVAFSENLDGQWDLIVERNRCSRDSARTDSIVRV
jgi:hypothetical protein